MDQQLIKAVQIVESQVKNVMKIIQFYKLI